jgi:hypothetical protein
MIKLAWEPEIGGVLGRAMERARRSGQRPDEGRPRDELPGTTADLLTTPLGGLGAGLFGAAVVSAAVLLRDDWYGMTLAIGGLVIVFWGAAQAARGRAGARIGIIVGSDSVLVRGRFIPYSRIRSVNQEQRQLRSLHDHALHRVWLELEGGEIVRLREGYSEGLRNASVAEIANAVEEARAAWSAGHAGAPEELLARGGRSAAEWVIALRRLGSAGAGVYRAVNADVEQISRLLDDPRAAPTARAAAAIALAACGDGTASRRLRIAAGSMANPRLRVALEQVASAGDDDALAGALAEVLEADREPPGAREAGRVITG